ASKFCGVAGSLTSNESLPTSPCSPNRLRKKLWTSVARSRRSLGISVIAAPTRQAAQHVRADIKGPFQAVNHFFPVGMQRIDLAHEAEPCVVVEARVSWARSPDGQSALNLAAARLRYIAGTAWSTKRYLNIELLKDQQMRGAIIA